MPVSVSAAPKEHVTLGLAILKAMDAGHTARAEIIAHVQSAHPDTAKADIEAAARLVIDVMTADEEGSATR